MALAFMFCIAKRLSWRETFPGACLHRIVSGLFRLNFLNGRSLLQSGRNDDDSRPFGSGRPLTTLWREGYERLLGVYDWFERTCWGSLSRKLSSFLMLFFIDVAYLGIYMSQKGAVRESLTKSGANAETISAVDAVFDHGLVFMLVLTAFALAWNIGQILYIRYLIVRPVRVITRIFNETARGEGDFPPTCRSSAMMNCAISPRPITVSPTRCARSSRRFCKAKRFDRTRGRRRTQECR